MGASLRKVCECEMNKKNIKIVKFGYFVNRHYSSVHRARVKQPSAVGKFDASFLFH